MDKQKKVLLLVGSPRAERSTSFSIGKYLCDKIKGANYSIEFRFIIRLMKRKERQAQIIELINQSNLIILTFPLYIDHLPFPVIKMMEFLSNNKGILLNREDKAFLSICNSGFPESSQNELAIEVCRNFCNAMGFQWRGGLQKGGGQMIHGRDLDEMGKRAEDLRKGLELAAEALKKQQTIPKESMELISKNTIPIKMYKTMGNIGWRTQALGNWNLFNLKDKPYKK